MKLFRILKKLKNSNIVVELKNGTIISGTVSNIDKKMNTSLKNVRLIRKKHAPISQNSTLIRGSSIRHYVLGESLPIESILANEIALDEKKAIEKKNSMQVESANNK